MLAVGKPMLWLFGPDFVAGYVFMLILSVGLLARAAVGPAERLLNMLGEQRICAAVYAAALAFNVAFCVALIPQYGGVGAAFATSGAIVLESALLFVVGKAQARPAHVLPRAAEALNEALMLASRYRFREDDTGESSPNHQPFVPAEAEPVLHKLI